MAYSESRSSIAGSLAESTSYNNSNELRRRQYQSQDQQSAQDHNYMYEDTVLDNQQQQQQQKEQKEQQQQQQQQKNKKDDEVVRQAQASSDGYRKNQLRKLVWLMFVIASIVFIFYAYMDSAWVVSQETADRSQREVGIVRQCIGSSCQTLGIKDIAHVVWKAVAVLVGYTIALLLIQAIAIIVSFRYFINNHRLLKFTKFAGLAACVILFVAMIIWPIGLDNTSATPCDNIDSQAYFMCDPWDIGLAVYLMIIGMVLLSFAVCFSMLVSSKPLPPISEKRKKADADNDGHEMARRASDKRKANSAKNTQGTKQTSMTGIYLPSDNHASGAGAGAGAGGASSSGHGRGSGAVEAWAISQNPGYLEMDNIEEMQAESPKPFVPYTEYQGGAGAGVGAGGGYSSPNVAGYTQYPGYNGAGIGTGAGAGAGGYSSPNAAGHRYGTDVVGYSSPNSAGDIEMQPTTTTTTFAPYLDVASIPSTATSNTIPTFASYLDIAPEAEGGIAEARFDALHSINDLHSGDVAAGSGIQASDWLAFGIQLPKYETSNTTFNPIFSNDSLDETP